LLVRLIIELAYLAVLLYVWLIVARAVLSWVRPRPGTTVYRVEKVLLDVTEPYVGLFRRFLPVTRIGSVGIDWSSLVALLVLLVALQVLARL
jgi:YggT family protein